MDSMLTARKPASRTRSKAASRMASWSCSLLGRPLLVSSITSRCLLTIIAGSRARRARSGASAAPQVGAAPLTKCDTQRIVFLEAPQLCLAAPAAVEDATRHPQRKAEGHGDA